ncbi:NYN domain-containing protein [Helicobacter cetorum]|uniref:NYN domain-containing protein n=1 Tax=Helicobacter cetorum TaxID=138563 RepID=UPI000CF05A2B|nr:NYN domain-containing protein [Helicobacter cetorum]
MKKENKIAVFFDCENVSAEYVDFVFNELQNRGEVIIRQSFKDWDSNLESNSTKAWDRKLHEKFAIEPIQVFSKTGKNSCDLRIQRAILETINQDHIDTIALVSSDGDFRDLIITAKSKGFDFIGFGEQSKAPNWIGKTYTTFINLEKQRTIQDEVILEVIKNTIEENKQDNGYMLASNLGDALRKKNASYIAKNFGSNSWGEFLRKYDAIFEIKSISKNNNGIKDTLVVKIK